jgi:hypothetical protein
MARPTTVLVIFLVSLNLVAGIVTAQGIDTLIGVDATVGEDQAIDNAASSTKNVSTGNSIGDTLFGMYNVLATGVSNVYGTIYPALNMLDRAGVAGYIVYGILGNLFTFVIFFDVALFLRRGDL